ncbi:MAG: metallophosphoesterase family protein [Rikenellaceae bacterium]
MKIVGVISDTHGALSDGVIEFLSECDVVIHAGDIGSVEIADKMKKLFNFKAVYGNVDNHIIRKEYKSVDNIRIEDTVILITHIGGYPKNYYGYFKPEIERVNPDIVVCGHSHILKVVYDNNYNHLHINPGACGFNGVHQVRTAVRFKIDKKRIFDLEVAEWKRD